MSNSEVTKRFVGKGSQPSGIGGKIIGQWNAIAGGRIFRLVEQDDPKSGFVARYDWNDLGKGEIIPVIESAEALKLIPKKK